MNYVDPSELESCECKVFDLANMSNEQRKKFQIIEFGLDEATSVTSYKVFVKKGYI